MPAVNKKSKTQTRMTAHRDFAWVTFMVNLRGFLMEMNLTVVMPTRLKEEMDRKLSVSVVITVQKLQVPEIVNSRVR